MSERDYSHRSTVDKLGIKPGQCVLVDQGPLSLDPGLLADIEERARVLASDSHVFDVALIGIDAKTDPAATLERLKGQMQADGGIGLLTPKRGRPGYVNQDSELIPAGASAGLVDNKICSVSDSISAMRFVLRKEKRASHPPVPGYGS